LCATVTVHNPIIATHSWMSLPYVRGPKRGRGIPQRRRLWWWWWGGRVSEGVGEGRGVGGGGGGMGATSLLGHLLQYKGGVSFSCRSSACSWLTRASKPCRSARNASSSASKRSRNHAWLARAERGSCVWSVEGITHGRCARWNGAHTRRPQAARHSVRGGGGGRGPGMCVWVGYRGTYLGSWAASRGAGRQPQQ
jgi:hypothetical protein